MTPTNSNRLSINYFSVNLSLALCVYQSVLSLSVIGSELLIWIMFSRYNVQNITNFFGVLLGDKTIDFRFVSYKHYSFV